MKHQLSSNEKVQLWLNHSVKELNKIEAEKPMSKCIFESNRLLNELPRYSPDQQEKQRVLDYVNTIRETKIPMTKFKW